LSEIKRTDNVENHIKLSGSAEIYIETRK